MNNNNNNNKIKECNKYYQELLNKDIEALTEKELEYFLKYSELIIKKVNLRYEILEFVSLVEKKTFFERGFEDPNIADVIVTKDHITGMHELKEV